MALTINYCIYLIFTLLICCNGMSINRAWNGQTNPQRRPWMRNRLTRAIYLRKLIVGNSPANIIDHPYQVLLMINGKPKCGGSVIKSNFILTAAHCIHNTKVHQLQIRAGSTDRTSGGQIREVQNIYYPEDKFNIDTYDFDIAILQLVEHLVFNDAVASIELPQPGKEIKEYEMAKATGWGMTDPLDDTLPKILQVVKLPQISTSNCRKYYGNLISERMFCAGYEEGGKDTCLGDSGGPLAANSTLIGITSWGGDVCAQAGKPGVFTKISFFREFIDDIINNNMI